MVLDIWRNLALLVLLRLIREGGFLSWMPLMGRLKPVQLVQRVVCSSQEFILTLNQHSHHPVFVLCSFNVDHPLVDVGHPPDPPGFQEIAWFPGFSRHCPNTPGKKANQNTDQKFIFLHKIIEFSTVTDTPGFWAQHPWLWDPWDPERWSDVFKPVML